MPSESWNEMQAILEEIGELVADKLAEGETVVDYLRRTGSAQDIPRRLQNALTNAKARAMIEGAEFCDLRAEVISRVLRGEEPFPEPDS